MPRDYKEEAKYHATREQKVRRAQRNKARRKAIREGRAKVGDGTEVHHHGNNRRGKLGNKTSVVSKKYNRTRQPRRDGSQD